MATKFILDTHALIWHLEGNSRLGPAAQRVLDSPASSLILPVIALAEAVHIVERRRTRIPGVTALIQDLDNDPPIEIYPLTEDILRTSVSLISIPEIHDRLIVATGVHLQNLGETVEIVTKDNEIIVASLLTVTW